MMSLEEKLRALTREGELYRNSSVEGRIECYACAHRCRIAEGKAGICRVRYNKGGKLMIPWGYVGAWQCDPIEKKPFFHAYPGSLAMSFGMLGCDLHCDYCQNWDISQTLRDQHAGRPPKKVSADEFVESAVRYGARAVVSTYNEPLITSEWAVEIFKRAREEGMATGYVSNGNATEEVIEYLRPHMDMYKVDLKTFSDANYRKLGARLESILDSIQNIHKSGLWLEVVTLLIPGFNDDPGEVKEMADFLVGVSDEIPWHITAFHPDYKMTDRGSTSPRSLIDAVEVGRKAGLKYVYAGNRPGSVRDNESTFCHNCGELLVQRHSFSLLKYSIDGDKCPSCRTKIPGIWEKPPERKRMFYFF